MQQIRKQFLECLFDLDQRVAWGSTDGAAWKAKNPWPEFLYTDSIKFCINPLVHHRDTKDILTNNNCYALLFECDDSSISPKEQAKRLLLSGIPFSTMVYSGRKSIHMIIRFTEPMQDQWQQKSWWKTIAKALETYNIIVDPSARLIPQLSRVPESINPKTGKKQQAIQIRNRVTYTEMQAWLTKNGHPWYSVEEPVVEQIDWQGNDHVSSIQRFKMAIRWNNKAQGIYSPWAETGGHIWLVKFGILCYTLDIPLDTSQRLSVLEWGEEYKGNNGGGSVATAVKKGWHWALQNRVNKKQLK